MNTKELVERLKSLKVPRTKYSISTGRSFCYTCRRFFNVAKWRRGYTLEYDSEEEGWMLYRWEPERFFWRGHNKIFIDQYDTEAAACEMLFRALVKDKAARRALNDEQGTRSAELKAQLLERKFLVQENVSSADDVLLAFKFPPVEEYYTLEYSDQTETWNIWFHEGEHQTLTGAYYSETTACREFERKICNFGSRRP